WTVTVNVPPAVTPEAAACSRAGVAGHTEVPQRDIAQAATDLLQTIWIEYGFPLRYRSAPARFRGGGVLAHLSPIPTPRAPPDEPPPAGSVTDSTSSCAVTLTSASAVTPSAGSVAIRPPGVVPHAGPVAAPPSAWSPMKA